MKGRVYFSGGPWDGLYSDIYAPGYKNPARKLYMLSSPNAKPNLENLVIELEMKCCIAPDLEYVLIKADFEAEEYFYKLC